MGLVVTLGLLAWALHGVDARALIAHLRRANPWLMVATIALATLTFPLRAVRWRLILRGAGGSPLPHGICASELAGPHREQIVGHESDRRGVPQRTERQPATARAP